MAKDKFVPIFDASNGTPGMVRRAQQYFMNQILPGDRAVFQKHYRATGSNLTTKYTNPETYTIGGGHGNKITSLRQNMHVGGLYIYKYDAKYKDVLPYWDVFPLIFLMRVTPKHFLGLNLHYIAPRQRSMLMDAIRNHLISNNLDPADMDDNMGKRSARATAASYQQLERISRHVLFAPCVKLYLHTHVKSRFTKIPYDQWHNVIFLPIQRFHGKSSSHVWRQSALNRG